MGVSRVSSSLTFRPVQLKSSPLLPEGNPEIGHGGHSVMSGVWLCYPTDCSPPGLSVHDILQTRILEWVAIPFSRESSWPRDQTRVSCIRGGFYPLSPREAQTPVSTWRCTRGIPHSALVLTPLQPNGYLCDLFTCSLLLDPELQEDRCSCVVQGGAVPPRTAPLPWCIVKWKSFTRVRLFVTRGLV